MFTLADCEWFSCCLFATRFCSLSQLFYALSTTFQKHGKFAPRYHNTSSVYNVLHMVHVCYGTFSNTYAICMWWKKLLGIQVLKLTPDSLLQLFWIIDFTALITLIFFDPESPDMLVGSIWWIIICLFRTFLFP